MISSYIIIYLCLLIKFSNETLFPLTPDIGTALNYILDNIETNISLEFLADYCHLSLTHFKRKFKSEMGISPRNFINQQKIECAKQLLLEGHSITDTSMSLEFSTTSYFAAIFKKYTAYTPTEYVWRHKGKALRAED
jgi:AraC-like DNA-binding protein